MDHTTLTIGVCCSLVLLSVFSCIMNPLFRLPKKRVQDGEDDDSTTSDSRHDDMPPLSVIVMVHDNADALERNLPLYLQQDYSPGYQIIVVANEGDSAASDLIKLHAGAKHLQSTFIPVSTRYVSKEKLGVTLGVKAANHEWCILTDALCQPASNLWLKHMAQACTTDNNIVVGYSNFNTDAKMFQRFARLSDFARIYREAVSSKPFAANFSNLAFRKSEFIAGDGYRGNLDCVRGEYDFIVNKYARKGSTGVVEVEGTLLEEAPTNRQWHRRRVFHIHSCRLMKGSFLHKAIKTIDTAALHSAWLANIAAVAFAVYAHNWILLVAAAAALLILLVWRSLTGMKAAKRFDASIPLWAIAVLELTAVWHDFADRLRYSKQSKYDFTCHKI